MYIYEYQQYPNLTIDTFSTKKYTVQNYDGGNTDWESIKSKINCDKKKERFAKLYSFITFFKSLGQNKNCFSTSQKSKEYVTH